MELRDLKNASPAELDKLEEQMGKRRRGNGTPGVEPKALRICRIYRDFSQVELAKASGVSRTTIIKLEDGAGARMKTIEKLAKALDLQPETLIGDPLEDEETG